MESNKPYQVVCVWDLSTLDSYISLITLNHAGSRRIYHCALHGTWAGIGIPPYLHRDADKKRLLGAVGNGPNVEPVVALRAHLHPRESGGNLSPPGLGDPSLLYASQVGILVESSSRLEDNMPGGLCTRSQPETSNIV
ncbi:hypothetical protein RRG08_043793 [Elysia crispata]|uniref:Uncharacterized protein n=1 Tax=Elysia crispata TaxID=231223 RepID=A0AAE0Z4X3_9GAST|nr:hypothetical protein RRG08_043793 [Elysia crispata]